MTYIPLMSTRQTYAQINKGLEQCSISDHATATKYQQKVIERKLRFARKQLYSRKRKPK